MGNSMDILRSFGEIDFTQFLERMVLNLQMSFVILIWMHQGMDGEFFTGAHRMDILLNLK